MLPACMWGNQNRGLPWQCWLVHILCTAEQPQRLGMEVEFAKKLQFTGTALLCHCGRRERAGGHFASEVLNRLLCLHEVPSILTKLNLLLSAEMLPDSGRSGAALRCSLHPQ